MIEHKFFMAIVTRIAAFIKLFFHREMRMTTRPRKLWHVTFTLLKFDIPNKPKIMFELYLFPCAYFSSVMTDKSINLVTNLALKKILFIVFIYFTTYVNMLLYS